MNTTHKKDDLCFPLPGAQGVDATTAAEYEGRWRLLEADGHLVAADEARLANVSVELRFGYLVLRAPGMLRLDIPLDVIEDDPSVLDTVNIDGTPRRVADEGAWAHAWFTEVLGRQVRLVKVCEELAEG